LRQGRTTPAQQRALEELLPKYGIPFPQEITASKPLPATEFERLLAGWIPQARLAVV